jgi:hypothetical protein
MDLPSHRRGDRPLRLPVMFVLLNEFLRVHIANGRSGERVVESMRTEINGTAGSARCRVFPAKCRVVVR